MTPTLLVVVALKGAASLLFILSGRAVALKIWPAPWTGFMLPTRDRVARRRLVQTVAVVCGAAWAAALLAAVWTHL